VHGVGSGRSKAWQACVWMGGAMERRKVCHEGTRSAGGAIRRQGPAGAGVRDGYKVMIMVLV
jgi:hypothetical protein